MQKIILDVNVAESRLESIRELALEKKTTNFWRQCVRDIDGSWDKYVKILSLEGARYFYGSQPEINYKEQYEVDLLWANIDVRHKIYSTFASRIPSNLTEFKTWIESLHSIMEYRPTEAWKLDVHATTTHTQVVLQDVSQLAKEFNDSYGNGVTGPVFAGFPVESLPVDEIEGALIRHTYPSLEYKDVYMEAAYLQLVDLLCKSHTKRSYIYGVAYFYQILINLHYFPSINTSLYMNIANGLLEIAGINGIEHGIKDFVAMRLQPDTYGAYFYQEIAGRDFRPLLNCEIF